MPMCLGEQLQEEIEEKRKIAVSLSEESTLQLSKIGRLSRNILEVHKI